MKAPVYKKSLPLKEKIHIIIEGTDTPVGRFFDVVLLIGIALSVVVVMLDSVLYLRLQYGRIFLYAEWFFTILFTIEYLLRLYSAPNRKRYAFSFFGVIDLLALLLVTIFCFVIYVVEGPENGYTSIPKSIYWAVVTLTTVGYGDISPKTPIGQTIASMVMIMGYSIIAVPTGIFTSELSRTMRPQLHPITCPKCGKFGHASNAKFCDRCGHDLHL